MSYTSDYFAYKESIQHGIGGKATFYGLLMAAMRQSDSFNAARLQAAFPEVWEDLQARYNAPGGVLDTDPDSLRAKVLG